MVKYAYTLLDLAYETNYDIPARKTTSKSDKKFSSYMTFSYLQKWETSSQGQRPMSNVTKMFC